MQLLETQYTQLGFDPAQGVEQQLGHRAQADGKRSGDWRRCPSNGRVRQAVERRSGEVSRPGVSEMHDVEGETREVVKAWRAGDTRSRHRARR